MTTVIGPGYKEISPRVARSLKDQFDIAIDTHCHTNASYDVINQQLTPVSVVRVLEEKGFVPVITDHDTYEGVKEVRQWMQRNNYSFEFITGVEFTLKPRWVRAISPYEVSDIHTIHIGVLGLDEEQFNELLIIASFGDLDGFINYCGEKGLPNIYNHIFWCEGGEKLNWQAVPVIVRNYFDVVELNAKRTKEQNDLTMELAKELGVSLVAAGDSHIGNPGLSYSFGPGRNFDEFWWEYVITGNSYVVREDLTSFRFIMEVKKFIRDYFKASPEYLQDKLDSLDTGIGFLQLLIVSLKNGRLRKNRFLKKTIEVFLNVISRGFVGRQLVNHLYLNPQKRSVRQISPSIMNICRDLHYFDDSGFEIPRM
jgi:predicted metal-dependent phosphoesterase TrpH